MKKTILFAFIALSFVSCNSFRKSDWKVLEDVIRFDELIDVAREKVLDDIDDGKYSRAYLRGEYKERLEGVVGDNLLAATATLLTFSNDDNWCDALDNLYDWAKEQGFTSSTISHLVLDSKDELGLMERILAEDMLGNIVSYHQYSYLTRPKFYMKAGDVKIYRFYSGLTEECYQLFYQDGCWHWRQEIIP